MEENKSKQYTFGPDEKEILQKMNTVEASVTRNNQEKNQRELVSTKYYSELVINTKMGPVTLNNVFITAERNKEGEMSYHFRWIVQKENGEQTIEENLVVDENGQVYATDGFKACLGDAEIDIEGIMDENDLKKGRLKGISEKATQEKDEQQRNKEEKIQDEEQDEDDNETKEIEEDLKEQGEDLRISKYRKIKDSHISERMPEVFQDGTENGIAFSNKLNRFVIISKVNGKHQINENIEPAKMTWKTIISIDPNGEKVERKVPHALMKLPNNPNKEVAVTLDQYGDVDIETVNVLPCQERVARHVRAEGEGAEKEEGLEMRNEFKAGGKEYEHDIAHQVEEIEQAQRDENKTVDYDITEDDYIPNTEITWGELMENTGESLPKLIERYNRDMEGKKPEDSKEVVESIVQDFGIFPQRQC